MEPAGEARSTYQAMENSDTPKRRYAAAGQAAVGLVLCSVAFLAGRETAPELRDLGARNFLASSGSARWKPPDLPVFRPEPLAKKLIRHFDAYLMTQAAFDTPQQKLRNVGQWLAPEFTYETVGFPSTHSLAGWCLSGEESGFRTAFPTSGFSQMLFYGDNMHSTTTSYGNVMWDGELFGIPAPKNWTFFRVTDFYQGRPTGQTDFQAEREGLISWNLMMIDWADLLRRVGRPVLPKATLPEGLVLTAAANDGVPAPLSVVASKRDSVIPKKAAVGALEDNWVGDVPAKKWWHANVTFYGPGGIGRARSAAELEKHVLEPFRAAFANRTCDAKMTFCEGNYCASAGYLRGQHVGAWVGQPATNKSVGIRYAFHWRIVEDKIQEGWAIFDMPGFLEQIGQDFWEIARSHRVPLHESL